MNQDQVSGAAYDVQKVQVLDGEQELTAAEKEAVSQIRAWVYGICINKAKVEEIHVSPLHYQAGCGTCKDKTLIYLCAHKDEAPLVQINKPLVEVTLEDILANMRVLNDCVCSKAST